MNNIKTQLRIAMICDPIGENKSGVVISTLRFGKLLKERGHHVIFIGAKSAEHKTHSHHHDIKAYRFRSLPVPESRRVEFGFSHRRRIKKSFSGRKNKCGAYNLADDGRDSSHQGR